MPLFNSISFKLNEGEKVVLIDANKKNIFNAYFNDSSIKIPLYKCIKSDSLLIFIGIPYNTSIKKLAADSLSRELILTNFTSDSINYLYKDFRIENSHVSVLTKNINRNLVYILATSKSKKTIKSLLNYKALSNRFKNNL